MSSDKLLIREFRNLVHSLELDTVVQMLTSLATVFHWYPLKKLPTCWVWSISTPDHIWISIRNDGWCSSRTLTLMSSISRSFLDTNVLGVSKVPSVDLPDPSHMIQIAPPQGRFYSSCLVEVTYSSVGILFSHFSWEDLRPCAKFIFSIFSETIVYLMETYYQSSITLLCLLTVSSRAAWSFIPSLTRRYSLVVSSWRSILPELFPSFVWCNWMMNSK